MTDRVEVSHRYITVMRWSLSAIGVGSLLLIGLILSFPLPSQPKVDCTGCRPVITAPPLEKWNEGSLYKCSNDKQFWEEGCKHYPTKEGN